MNSVEKYALSFIGEDPATPDVFTEGSEDLNLLRGNISDAVQEINMMSGSYVEVYELQLREARAFYRLPSMVGAGFFGWIKDAWTEVERYRLEQTDITKLNAYNRRWLFDSGTPLSYFPIGLNNIGFWPKPANDGGIIELSVAVIPFAITTSGARIKLRRDLEYAAAHLAVAEYFATRGDTRSAQQHLQEYVSMTSLDMPDSPVGWRPRLRSSKEPQPKYTG
jgi:hypothetical protein